MVTALRKELTGRGHWGIEKETARSFRVMSLSLKGILRTIDRIARNDNDLWS
jgi:hypothetical protein